MHLALLWHLHQPVYRHPENGEYVLPWVNFHSVKNYHQMASLAEETEFPCIFNFAPCLIEQIRDYAEGKAVDPSQEALEVDASKLTPLQLGLLEKFVAPESTPARTQLKALQAFFSPVCAETRNDKDELLNLRKKIIRNLIPRFRRLMEEGRVELTVSPYYHPILPLIFDITAADVKEFPSSAFHYPEDGETQLERAREYFKLIFGDYPLGLWPSEGAISREVASSAARKGFSFTVTDENVLWKSLGTYEPEKRYKPFSSDGLAVFFRDRELSDLISFHYQHLKEKEAARDFIKRLESRRKTYGDEGICVIALDGENPWSYYPQNGVPFLREFYTRIKKHSGIIPVFFHDYLSRFRPAESLTLEPGTWMGSFAKWIGSPGKNRAWDTLSKARKLCGPSEEILVAEGSDWFWWYDDTEEKEFDFLFKGYIRKAYKSAGIRYEEK